MFILIFSSAFKERNDFLRKYNFKRRFVDVTCFFVQKLLICVFYSIILKELTSSMKTRIACILVLITLAAAAPSLATCSNQMSSDLIQVGAVVFTDLFGNYEKCYDVAVTYPVPPSGLSSIASLFGYAASLLDMQFDFSLISKQRGSSNTLSIILLTEQRWTNVKIGYLAHSRPDIFAGSFMIDTTSTFSCSTSGLCQESGAQAVSLAYPLAAWTPNPTATFSPFVMIAGVKSGTTPSYLNVSSTFNPVTGVLTAIAQFNATTSVESVKIVYLIIQNTFTGVLSNGFSTAGERSFLSSQLIMGGLMIQSTISLSMDRLNCQGSACPTLCVTNAVCKSINGVANGLICSLCLPNTIWSAVSRSCVCNAFSVNIGGQCTVCPENSLPNYDGTACACLYGYTSDLSNVTSCVSMSLNAGCGAGTSLNILNGVCECTLKSVISLNCNCPSGASRASSSSPCTCNFDSIYMNGQCIQCTNGKTPDPTQAMCICPANSFIDSQGFCKVVLGSMKCPRGATFDETLAKCVCPENMIAFEKDCVCDFNKAYFAVAQNPTTCVKDTQCMAGSTYNTVTQQCACQGALDTPTPTGCICSAPNVIVNGVCSCAAGAILTNGVCITCGTNFFVDSAGQCACKSGYFSQGDQCIIVPYCAPGSSFNMLTHTCDCSIPSMTYSSQGCRCPKNMYLSGSACSCATGFHLVNEICVPKSGPSVSCSADSSYSASTQSCICSNPNEAYYSSGCKCSALNMIPTASNTNCVCDLNSYQDASGSCNACEAHATPNGKGCVCNSGYEQTANGLCVLIPPQPQGSTYNSITNSFTCTINEQIIKDSNCVCPANTYLANGGCICVAGYTTSSTGCAQVTGPFNCPAGSTLGASGSCICSDPTQAATASGCICAGGSMSSANGCACPAGSIKVNSSPVECVSCGANSAPNPTDGKTCLCKVGFYASPNGCVPQIKCPANSVFNPATYECVCSGKYSILLGGQCTCQSGMKADENGNCACPSGAFYLGGGCVNCWLNSAIGSSGSCECAAGYYLSDLYSCSMIPTCGTDSTWNSVTKICQCTNPSFVQGASGACGCPAPLKLDQSNRCVCGDSNQPSCECLPYSTFSPTSGCIPIPPATSVSITGAISTVGRLSLAVCVNSFNSFIAQYLPSCPTCTTLKATVTSPQGYSPLVGSIPIKNQASCFLLEFIDSLINENTISLELVLESSQDPSVNVNVGLFAINPSVALNLDETSYLRTNAVALRTSSNGIMTLSTNDEIVTKPNAGNEISNMDIESITFMTTLKK